MPLRSPDLSPGRIEALRSPFERDRQGRIEAVKIGQEIARAEPGGESSEYSTTGSPSRRRLRRSASSSETASRQFMPLPVAPSHGVPGRLVSSLKTSEASWALSKRTGVRSSTSARLASTVWRNAAPPLRWRKGGTRIHGRFCAAPSSSSRRPSTRAHLSLRRPRWIGRDRASTQYRRSRPAPAR